MKKELLRHKTAYFCLLLGLFAFVTMFVGVWPNRSMQRLSVFAVMLFYFLWGIVTHAHSKSLTQRVALEYLMIAAFGGSLLLLLTISL